MSAHEPSAPSNRRSSPRQTKRMRRFSTLAGPFAKLPSGHAYTVSFNSLTSNDRLLYRLWVRFVAYGALLLVIGFGAILFHPSHWIALMNPQAPTVIVSWVMLLCLALLEVFLVIGTYSATRSTLKARDPVPVRPPGKLNVAFATTRAPGEPITMVRTTLEAMKQVRYKTGHVDVWLLDETGDEALRTMCHELNVRYFSRSGISRWNTDKPTHVLWHKFLAITVRIVTLGTKRSATPTQPNQYYAAKSKHGNFNSWRQHLSERGIAYDILAGVDTDQVPEPNFLERLLGYFRDPDVAFVVGPQVYGNYAPGLKGVVARWAESQASFFQSTIQRAGNATNSAMFVGTNYAVRMTVLDQIGGFQHCITEDMATGLSIHARQNPATGKTWRSVYTPDVLAIGEGPDFWAPYFTQQWRWAAGTFDTWKRMVWRVWFKLPRGAQLHYFLMLTYYPMAALTWLLGIVSSMLYVTTGATAIQAPWNQFISLYMMLLVMQLSLYFWNRRFNVSPHEPEGSYGISGMVISTLTSPIYYSAFIGMLIGKKVNFVVTSKGDSTNPDWFPAFRSHLQWAALLTAGLIYGGINDHLHPAMTLWIVSQLAICLLPFVLGMALAVPERFRQRALKTRLLMKGAHDV